MNSVWANAVFCKKSKPFILVLFYFFMEERKSFEIFLILLGMFLILVELFNSHSSVGFSTGAFEIKIFHYIVVAAGIVLVVWGISRLNKPREEEWLMEGWE